ncbi:hypothetical protein ACM61V_08205 [Sphingomonas sp. TX0543]|uniref:hypothetical protein n=1 Tax=unclassified Sphingomonas TaxID=196159 RepID=UPI0014852BBD|nr:hypothetical protein [Sphingomonas sp. 3P27F8]
MIAPQTDDTRTVQLVRRPRRSDALGTSLRQAYRCSRTDEAMQELIEKLTKLS